MKAEELKKGGNNSNKYHLLKRYSGKAKLAVLTSIFMQLILLINLAIEVFPKEIKASGIGTFGLRLVLCVFMKFLFDQEQNSITMTQYYTYTKKIGPFL